MLSKKQALILGAVAIAGTGIGLMMLDKGEGEGKDNGGGEGVEESKKEFLIQYSAPVHAPTEIYAPYTETTITNIINKVITYVNPPPVPPRYIPPDGTEEVIMGGLILPSITPIPVC